MTAQAPRSGARRLAGGTRFLRTPGIDVPRIGPRQGCEESATPFQGADSRVVDVFQWVRKKRVPLANFPAPLRGAEMSILQGAVIDRPYSNSRNRSPLLQFFEPVQSDIDLFGWSSTRLRLRFWKHHDKVLAVRSDVIASRAVEHDTLYRQRRNFSNRETWLCLHIHRNNLPRSARLVDHIEELLTIGRP